MHQDHPGQNAERDAATHVHRQIKRASYLLIASVLLSRVIGFVREWVLAQTLGASRITDVYYASFTIPDFLNYLMAAGALSISFIPVLAKFQSEGKPEIGKLVFRSIATWMGLLLILLISVAFIWAPQLAEWVAPGFDPAQKKLLVQLLKIILPAQFFFYWGGLANSVQQTHGKFLYSALAPLIYNSAIVLCGTLYSDRWGVSAFSIGVLLGSFLGNGVMQYFALHQLGYSCLPYFKLTPEIRAAFRHYLWLSFPIMLGLSLVVTDEWISKYFATSLPGRGVTYLNLARTELRIPLAVIAQAAGIASFPYLSKLWASRAYTEFTDLLIREVAKLWCLAPVATLLLYFEAVPITHAIFGGGRLNGTDILHVSSVLRIMSLSLFFWATQSLIARGFYACHITWVPSLIGTLLSFALIPLYSAWGNRFGFEGLAAAGSVGIFLYTVLLLYLLRRHLSKYAIAHLEKNYTKLALFWTAWLAILGVGLRYFSLLRIYRDTQFTAIAECVVATTIALVTSFFVQRRLFHLVGKPALF